MCRNQFQTKWQTREHLVLFQVCRLCFQKIRKKPQKNGTFHCIPAHELKVGRCSETMEKLFSAELLFAFVSNLIILGKSHFRNIISTVLSSFITEDNSGLLWNRKWKYCKVLYAFSISFFLKVVKKNWSWVFWLCIILFISIKQIQNNERVIFRQSWL